MPQLKFLPMLLLSLSAVAPASAHTEDGQTPVMTAMDYIEIQQLVARYPYALDTHGDNGYMYANLFTADGTFGTTKGREALAALARSTQPEKSGPAATRHFLTNVIITPTPDGVIGRQYNVLIDVGDDAKPSAIDHGGHYEDVYVKTPAGWRFKSRLYVRSKLGPKPDPPPPSR
jgi:SnoaL-like domain